MIFNSVIGTVEFAKVLMSVFIMLYAYYFLRRSEDYDERKPWEYLYIASMFLFIVEVIAALQLFRGDEFKHQLVTNLRSFVEFAFIGFFLFSFIFQHNLILKRKSITIEEKPIITARDKMKGLLAQSKKKFRRSEEGPPPEEELEEELSEMDSDKELEKEEEEIENVLGEAEQKTEEEEKIIHLAENLVTEAEALLIRHGDEVDAKKAENLKSDLSELKKMLDADHKEIDLIEKKVKEILRHD